MFKYLDQTDSHVPGTQQLSFIWREDDGYTVLFKYRYFRSSCGACNCRQLIPEVLQASVKLKVREMGCGTWMKGMKWANKEPGARNESWLCNLLDGTSALRGNSRSLSHCKVVWAKSWNTLPRSTCPVLCGWATQPNRAAHVSCCLHKQRGDYVGRRNPP